jgi:hypothetical protein
MASIPKCHRLLFLQMTCEKLVKAHLFGRKSAPQNLLKSHAVITKYLPSIINEYCRHQSGRNLSTFWLDRIRTVLRDIELLAPAVDAAGQQPANCEYPWLNASKDRVLIPAEHDFNHLNLEREPAGRLILKILPIAIAALISGQ